MRANIPIISLSSKLTLDLVLAVFVSAVCASISYLEVSRIFEQRAASVATAQVEIENLNKSLIQHADLTLRIADAILLGGIDRIDHGALVDFYNAAILRRWLKEEITQIRTISALSISDRNGALIFSTETDRPTASIADRDYFRHHAEHNDPELYIGTPIFGRIINRWIIPVSRRYNNADGSFAGVATANIDVDLFQKVYDQLDVGRAGAVLLMSTHGRLIVRRPFVQENVGRDMTDSNVFKALAKQSSGLLEVRAVTDGVLRFNSFRRSDDYPIVVAIAFSMDELLSPWRDQTIRSGITTAFVILIIVGAGFLVRTIAGRLLHSEQTAKVALENMSQGICMFNSESRLVTCNNRYRSLYRIPEGGAEPGMTILEMLQIRKNSGLYPLDPEQYCQQLQQALQETDEFSKTLKLNDGTVVQIINRTLSNGGWVSTHEDISEKVRSGDELASVKSFLETVIQNVPLPILIKDATTRKILLFNKAYTEFVGHPSENIKDATVFELFPESTAREITSHDDAALASGNVESRNMHEFSMSAAAGERIISTIRVVMRDEQNQPQYFLTLVEDITNRKNSEAQIEKLAHFDTLTGLANRNLFKLRLNENVARLKRLGTNFGVAMIDLDKFKAVNDRLGHQAGDELLKQVGARISETIRETDVAARLGGDEFAIVISPSSGSLASGAESLANRLIESVSAPYIIDGENVVIGCSVGIALAPGDGEKGDELLKNGDLALYKSKKSGSNLFHFYSDEMKVEADGRNALEGDLRQAIWRNEFELFYQPIVDTRTQNIRVMEALVRWRHPTRGLINPAEFIPLAEETGVIGTLGEWIMLQACTDATKMPAHIRVAVNLSPVQFARSNVVDCVILALVESQLPAERLELEITEGVLLQDTEQNSEALNQLKNLGVTISLDDFGTGYSSLSYLTLFSFDKIKIDRSFVEKLDRLESRAILSSIGQLSRTLNFITCIEGVETATQLERICTLGIDLCQGYLFSMPKPFAELSFDDRAMQQATYAA